MIKRIACVATAVLLTAPAAFGQAGGLVLYENGTVDMGSSYAGAVRAQDAATAFTNPAGMTRLEGNHMQLGIMAILSDMELGLDAPGTVSDPSGSLDGGGDLGGFAPGLGSFGVFNVNDRLSFGFAVTALAANGVDYERGWVGRTFVVENQFIAANFQPGVGYKVNDQWSVGASLNVVYGSLDQELISSTTIGSPSIEIDDADDFAFGGTFGVMFEPTETTRFGLTYRTELEFDLSGDIDVQMPIDVNFDTTMNFAQGANLSVYHALNERVALLGDVGWSDWSTFDRMPTEVGGMSGAIPRGWKDTWRLGVGVEWDAGRDWLLRSGFSYDSSPVDDDKRLPDIPVGEQFRFSIGAQHDFGQGKVFGISYTLLYAPMDVDHVALPGGLVLDGEYDPAMVHMIGMTYSITFESVSGVMRVEGAGRAYPVADGVTVEPMVQIEGLRFRYRHSDFALRVPSLAITSASAVAFTGPSGSGKTTLLNLIAGIRTPDEGRITVGEVRVDALDERARRAFRVRRLGLVFQEFELIEYLSVLDNILLPYRIGTGLQLERSTRERAAELARVVGIEDKLRRYVRRLSQGEKQRVALCRALLPQPGLLLADEPTGSLDPGNKRRVLDLLLECAREFQSTLIMVTHDHDLLDRFDRIVDFGGFHEAPSSDGRDDAQVGASA